MRSSRPVYCLIAEDDGSGSGPIIMESYVSMSKEELEHRAKSFLGRYGQCWVCELPIQFQTSLLRQAGDSHKVQFIAED